MVPWIQTTYFDFVSEDSANDFIYATLSSYRSVRSSWVVKLSQCPVKLSWSSIELNTSWSVYYMGRSPAGLETQIIMPSFIYNYSCSGHVFPRNESSYYFILNDMHFVNFRLVSWVHLLKLRLTCLQRTQISNSRRQYPRCIPNAIPVSYI